VKSFDYVIKDKNGIHARPIGLLVKEAYKYKSKILIKANGKTSEAKKIMEIMSMDVKWKDTVTIQVIGDDEDDVCAKMKEFLEQNL
jgi:phosphocarrier protein HPr